MRAQRGAIRGKWLILALLLLDLPPPPPPSRATPSNFCVKSTRCVLIH